MSMLLERKYASLLASRLERFKGNGRIFRARCPVCNDSKVNSRKTRFYIYPKDDKYKVFCHNCGYSHNFVTFLKDKFHDLYQEYNMEKIQEWRSTQITEPEPDFKTETASKFKNDILKTLTPISKLSHNHFAKQYVDSRKIPSHQHFRLYFHENFSKWVNNLIPEKLPDLKSDPRLIMVLKDSKGKVFGVQGRAILKTQAIRYVTIRFDEEQPKLYGAEVFDNTKVGLCLEGPIDSLFIPNAVAMVGASIPTQELLKYLNITNKDRLLMALDNEPRNKEIVNKMEKLLDEGMTIIIWPESFKSKDINQAVLDGYAIRDVTTIVKNNRFKGLEGKLKLASWRKC